MRICVLVDAWKPMWGGGQTHVWETSKILVRQHDLEIDVFTRSICDGKERYATDESHYGGKLNIRRIGPCTKFFNLFGRLAWVISVIFSVIQTHRIKKYDLIHAHAYISGLPGKLLSYLLKIPVVYTVHGANNLDLGRTNPVTLLENILLTKIKYDQEISVSHHFLKYNNVNQKICVIPNGVDVSMFDRYVSKIRRDHFFTLLWVGRFETVKNVTALVLAFRNLVNDYPYLRLVLIGDGREKEDIRKLCQKLKLNDLVKFKDQLKYTELIKAYKEANLFVLPSLSEGQPISLLEAWAAKLPVVATDVGDDKLLVKKDVNGWLVKPGDIQSLEKVLHQVIKRTDLGKIGQSGYDLVRAHCSWEKSSLDLYRIYQQLVDANE
ncbi:MAG: Glycosyl transferase group 1 [Candidatus Gottesmanbacteria bacterium GW2011_GWB1_43_11]|uniref:Glycosyl transferase group 1 n=1 Tax=Candidatus Gottesmanbacteria bacterium GW2011_GWB1_43_11 TaxID=1618446 RepID=A0A0G1CNU4_9BACT|nr:MAG: Glycosyl transferase group 1 [Candidatus Gottesmanbacteria bacterium GW2011_GWA2_42_16]KKS56238.1 MAG: Glycosyl transferase group 1 [Candidatus Gottesmanbacteria bacterium GW2011_GWA1_42_26]KKS82571.1 MAG: Glycosyl transferase group 1 [Candidatus Gottesmanbacteria bacterium GW2011_GWC1_43_10]KKS87440.1 MAG: Glycosyl transferase group 1 [Candidatus Gottesmanbacteria bacterium GW2011_GWB1_43_11]OGG10185.1 MAG: hypothetical protein A2699_01400 [Candidatus Gottesmanbacteria bacterium RIFCSP